MGECARALGVATGTIYRQVLDMHREGVIKADGDPPGSGIRYWVDPRRLDELDQAIQAGQPPGRVIAGQQFLLVEVTTLVALARALRLSDVSASVVWAAEVAGGTEFLLALDRRASLTQRGRVRAALEGEGIPSRPLDVTELQSGSHLRLSMAAVRDAAYPAAT